MSVMSLVEIWHTADALVFGWVGEVAVRPKYSRGGKVVAVSETALCVE
jgi:hypothetical protein